MKTFTKKDCGPKRSFLDNQSHSVTLNDLAMKAGKSYCNFKFQQRSHTITDINKKIVQINASFGRILLYDLLIACRKMTNIEQLIWMIKIPADLIFRAARAFFVF